MEDRSGDCPSLSLRSWCRPMWAPLVLAALLAVPVTSSGAGYAPNPERSLTAQQERRLVQSLFDLRRGRLDDAVRNASHLVRQQPDFDLAQLIYGDLLKAQTEPLPAFGYRFRRDLIDGHLEEARARLRRYLSAPPPVGVPEALLRLSPGVSAAIVIKPMCSPARIPLPTGSRVRPDLALSCAQPVLDTDLTRFGTSLVPRGGHCVHGYFTQFHPGTGRPSCGCDHTGDR